MVYGLAVREMRRRDAEDPTSWAYQAAVHWTDVRNPRALPGPVPAQHLVLVPWHRMYSYGFERIAGSILQTLHEVNEQTKATWGLPQGLGIVRVCLNSWDDVGRPPRALRVAHVQARSSSIDGCGSAASFQFVVQDDVHGV